MHINKFSIGKLRGVPISSIVNEGIRAFLNLFIIFLQEDFTRRKSTKHKQATFLLLDLFYMHKNHKKHKKHKMSNKQFSSS